MRYILPICMACLCCSCKSVLVKMYIKDPVVETNTSLRSFQQRAGSNPVYNYYLRIDTGSVESAFAELMARDTYFFNSKGVPICYKATSSCSGSILNEFLNNRSDSFRLCGNDNPGIDVLLQHAYNFNDQRFQRPAIADSAYYVVVFWQKFMGGKAGYRDAVSWVEKEVEKRSDRFKLIVVNGDLHESWQLAAGQRARAKVRTRANEASVDIDRFPERRKGPQL